MSEAAEDAEAAADELCDVLLAIEAVDYNRLTESDLQRLLSVRNTVENITQEYRQLQAVHERDDADTEGAA